MRYMGKVHDGRAVLWHSSSWVSYSISSHQWRWMSGEISQCVLHRHLVYVPSPPTVLQLRGCFRSEMGSLRDYGIQGRWVGYLLWVSPYLWISNLRSKVWNRRQGDLDALPATMNITLGLRDDVGSLHQNTLNRLSHLHSLFNQPGDAYNCSRHGCVTCSLPHYKRLCLGALLLSVKEEEWVGKRVYMAVHMWT